MIIEDYEKELTNNNKEISQKLNDVYDDEDYYKEFELISNVALESIKELTKNDTW